MGKNIIPLDGELLTDESYGRRLYRNAILLAEQGDGMRSFASVILQALAYRVLSIILLDEPEAFLHPPQAKILGRILAKERPRDAQLFIATHSVDILMGLLEAAPDNLRIIRLSREEGQKQAVELDKDKVKEIMRNPFLRYSNVLSGAFYKRAIICEDSSDCLFYQALLGAMGEPVSDALFLQTSGKDKFPQMAGVLKALGVPVSIIADIDILQDGSKGTFKGLIEALGGDWEVIEKLWSPLKQAIEQSGKTDKGQIIKPELKKTIEAMPNEITEDNLEQLKAAIEKALNSISPWKNLQISGSSAIPSGQASEQWEKLQKRCAEIGLWIVPVGIIEGFCKKIGGYGPAWVGEVLDEEKRGKLETRPDLREAREFISAVWGDKPEQLNS